MKVKFQTDKEVLNHRKDVVEDFRRGRIYDLVDSSARHWISRGMATPHKGDGPVHNHKLIGAAQGTDDAPLAISQAAGSGLPTDDGLGTSPSSSDQGQASTDQTSSDAGAGDGLSPSTGPASSPAGQTATTAATPAGGAKQAPKTGNSKKDKRSK